MYTPYLNVNIDKIKSNAKNLKDKLDLYGINIAFVTKGFCANIDIIKAVKSVGINLFADSRIKNIKNVKSEIGDINYILIRIPKLSEIEDVVSLTDYSLQSEVEVIEAISNEAIRQDKIHKIILMIDVGDLREGILIEDLDEVANKIKSLKGVKLIGIGTNVGCYGSIKPSIENTQILVDAKKILNEKYGFNIDIISGGSTCTCDLVFNGKVDREINMLRIGEAILFGEDSTNGKYIEGLEQETFVLGAEVIELKKKPSVPIGERGKDAFGREKEYIDYGVRDRAILAIGKQDTEIDALCPLSHDIKILGCSSDHMIVDVSDYKNDIKVGDIIEFRCGYGAVLSCTTSKYVDINIKNLELEKC